MGLKVEPPSNGIFLVTCNSDQDGYYSTTANLTLSVTEGGGDNGNGTAVKEISSRVVQAECRTITLSTCDLIRCIVAQIGLSRQGLSELFRTWWG